MRARVLPAFLLLSLPAFASGLAAESATEVPMETLPMVLPEGLSWAAAASDGTYVYVFGGQPKGCGYGCPLSDEIYRIDLATDAVTVAGELPTARAAMSAVWAGSAAYLFGGCVPGPVFCQESDDILRFDPATGVVETVATMPPGSPWNVGHVYAPAAYDGSHVYVFGGLSCSSGSPCDYYDHIVRFDPATHEVATMAETLPRHLYGASALFDGEDVYLFGGRARYNVCCSGDSDYMGIIRYDPATDDAVLLPTQLPARHSYATTRLYSSAVWDGEAAYVLGGYDAYPRYETYGMIHRFSPATGAVDTMHALLPEGRYAMATSWHDRGAVLAGGIPGTWDALVAYRPAVDHLNGRPVPVLAPVADVECQARGGTVSVDGSHSFDPEGDTLSYGWSAPGAVWEDAAAPVTTASLPFGTHTLTLLLDDGRERATGGVEARVVDTSGPSVAITAPEPGQMHLFDEAKGPSPTGETVAVGQLTLRADAADGCGIASVRFLVDGVEAAMDLDPPYEHLLNPPAGSAPLRHVEVVATDLGGHTANATMEFLHVATLVVDGREVLGPALSNWVHGWCGSAGVDAVCVALLGEDPYKDW